MSYREEIDMFLELPAYGLAHAQKNDLYTKMLTAGTKYHREKCPEYGRFLRALGCPAGSFFCKDQPAGAKEQSAETKDQSSGRAEKSREKVPVIEEESSGKMPADAQGSSGKMPADAQGSSGKMPVNAQGYDEKVPLIPEEEIPFLPVSIFKELDLRSIAEDQVFKVITSSGTGGQRPSRIFLDAETSAVQQKVLARIVSEEIGDRRLPCLMLDTKSILRDRSHFSARGAGILGFSVFASRICYALDENMDLKLDEIREFIEKHRRKALEKGEKPKFLLYGFTFMIWQYFVHALEDAGITLDLSGSVLIHGGGWKKLQSQAVSPEEFAARIRAVTGIETVRSYYGMAEQTGCICMECACGHLHTSTWSDVIVRREKDYSVCEIGEPGVLQVLTPIAMSYPGHSLLTEDRGVLLGEDDCLCGRKGKYFKVLGRLPKAEVRGCSDTFEK